MDTVLVCNIKYVNYLIRRNKMSDIELKPCPFCGGDVGIYDKFDDDIHKYFKIACGYCHLSMASYTYRIYSEEDRESTKAYLILAWNRRADNA